MIFTAFVLFVFPNSFRMIKLPLLLFVFAVGIFNFKKLNSIVTISLVLSFIVTFIYSIVGIPKSKLPEEAFSQVLVIYVFTPILWVVVLNYIFNKFPLPLIVKFLNHFMLWGCVSVFVAIWLFNTGRVQLLEYVIEDPNMNFKGGVVEMRLYVYGSLIFFIPAYIQLDKVLRNKIIYYVIILFCFITAVVSGRSALLLSIFVGLLFYISTNNFVKFLRYILIGSIVLGLSILILESFGVDLGKIFVEFYSKIFEGQDKARPEQTQALYEGINQNIFGAGHGVGVDYIRSFKFPWRYENVPFALIYRVSFFGFLVYSIPFIYSVYKFINIKNKSPYDKYMIIGYVSMLIATFTNPYLESFEFNIFYVLPFMYFVNRNKIFNAQNHLLH